MNSRPAFRVSVGGARAVSASSVGRFPHSPLAPSLVNRCRRIWFFQRCAWPQARRTMATASIELPTAWAAD